MHAFAVLHAATINADPKLETDIGSAVLTVRGVADRTLAPREAFGLCKCSIERRCFAGLRHGCVTFRDSLPETAYPFRSRPPP